jgi:hypothetical protein
MDSDKLRQLAERVMAATGPDRELDCDILGAVDPERLAYFDAEYERLKTAIEAMGPEAVKHRMPGLRSHSHHPPAYSRSLDAAMTLVPEGWLPLMDSTDATDGGHSVELYGPDDTPIVSAKASTLPNALTAATLLAIASTQDHPQHEERS